MDGQRLGLVLFDGPLADRTTSQGRELRGMRGEQLAARVPSGSLPRADGRWDEVAYRVSQRLGEPLDGASIRLVLRRLYQTTLIERPSWSSHSGGETPRALGAAPCRRGCWPRGAERRSSVSRAGRGHVPAIRRALFAQFPVLWLLLQRQIRPLRRRQEQLRSSLTRGVALPAGEPRPTEDTDTGPGTYYSLPAAPRKWSSSSAKRTLKLVRVP